MDPKTKQLVERVEENAIPDIIAERYAKDNCDDMLALCSAVREQDERAQHAEEERGALSKRIAELEAQLQERTEAAKAWDALAVARLKTINDLSTKLDNSEGRMRLLLLDRADVIKALTPYSKSEDSAVGSARDAALKLDYALRLARFAIQQRALITDEMKALAVSVIG